ncbi:MAG: hypothetical protein H7833_02735 [Magnetococcus sp. DMHC-1]|nr:hypothetical protein [Magnetococcales bacterium]
MAKDDDDDGKTRAGPADRDAAPERGSGKEKEGEEPAKGNKLLLPLIGVGVLGLAAGAYLLFFAKKPVDHTPTRAELLEKARLLIDDRIQDSLQAESQSRLLGQSSPLLASPGAELITGRSAPVRTGPATAPAAHATEPTAQEPDPEPTNKGASGPVLENPIALPPVGSN